MAQVVHNVSPAVVRERIHASPEQIAAFCRAHHIRWLALFGSVLRDDFTDESDIDVLVECAPEYPMTFFDLHDIEQELSCLFGERKVDLVTATSLYWRMRDRVLRSMIVLYGDAPEIPDAAVPDIVTAKDDRVYIGIMWDTARILRDHIHDKTPTEYGANEALHYALAHLLQRFSARSAQVSRIFREAHREVAWHETDSMYHRVSPDGLAIDDQILWEIVAHEIPALIPLLECILPPEMQAEP